MNSLSVLIPTLPERYSLLNRLQKILIPQVERFPNRVCVLYNDAGRQATIGEKRNSLMSRVQTDYSVFIDDDDIISNQYIQKIMAAIDQNPDCVTFNGWMSTNGRQEKDFVIKLGERYEERNNIYYRFPNHLVPMRTSLVRHIQFPNVAMGEDYAWAKTINDKKILKTSVHIEDKLYHYVFLTNKPSYGQPTRLRR